MLKKALFLALLGVRNLYAQTLGILSVELTLAKQEPSLEGSPFPNPCICICPYAKKLYFPFFCEAYFFGFLWCFFWTIFDKKRCIFKTSDYYCTCPETKFGRFCQCPGLAHCAPPPLACLVIFITFSRFFSVDIHKREHILILETTKREKSMMSVSG